MCAARTESSARRIGRLALLALGALGGACSSRAGLWRDQFIFVGSDGSVVALALTRQDTGTAEAKAWFGQAGEWKDTFYQRFATRRGDAATPFVALAALSSLPGSSVRASLGRGPDVRLTLRTPAAPFEIDAAPPTALGSHRDPEGRSRYKAGRAILRAGREHVGGWLVIEETPEGQPRRPFVEFGTFVFVVAVKPNGDLVVAKHSLERSRFDFAASRVEGRLRRSKTVFATFEGDRLILDGSSVGVRAEMTVRDRDETEGVSPSGRSLSYGTLLLDGGFAGVAFTIRPSTRASKGEDPIR